MNQILLYLVNNKLILAFSFMLYLRLFIVMGMHVSISCFLYEILPGGIMHGLIDISESLEGVWIFVLFVLKRNVLQSIKRRYSNVQMCRPN